MAEVPDEHVLPLLELDREDEHFAVCSVTGGYVYRGRAIQELYGAYVFGDSCAMELQALIGTDDQWSIHGLGVKLPPIVSFAEDLDGELLVISWSTDHGVYRLEPTGVDPTVPTTTP